MNQKEIVESLATVPLFAGASKKELRAVAAGMKEVAHDAGDVLVKEGESGVGFFLIAEGTARVVVGGRTRRRLGEGEFFGEIAVLDGGPRSATVIADTPMRMLGITPWVFKGLLRQYPSLAMKMLEVVASRLRAASSSGTD